MAYSRNKYRTEGGWIEHVRNLSPFKNCMICGDVKVYESAIVSGDAHVEGQAEIHGNAKVSYYA